MRDPCMASDGHSYDREAIEMWLRTHETSPRTGQPLEHRRILPNHNLKRLIKDLITEGGTALYQIEDNAEMAEAEGDGSNCPYRYALVPETVLILKCLGPVESDFNLRSFRVTEKGCMGGRKRPQSHHAGLDFMHLNDATVSRTHFELMYIQSERQFRIKDKGSAGGTFIRVPFGVPKPLFPGLMIMLGKHQLLVKRAGQEHAGNVKKNDASSQQDSKDDSRPTTPVMSIASSPTNLGNPPADGGADDQVPGGGEDDASVPDTPMGEDKTDIIEDEEEAAASQKILELTIEQELKLAHAHKVVELECFAPEGTPIQGHKFLISREGATLGRRQSNTVPFSHEVEGAIMGIDSSISGEHARISYCAKEECLQLWDGTPSKPSTNGTWFRLSPMHTESEPYPIRNGAELLIGTVRFSVTLDTMVVERDASEVWSAEGEGSNRS